MMLIIRKLPVGLHPVSQLTINSLFTICKRKDAKVLSCLIPHTSAKTYIGTRYQYKTFLLPSRGRDFNCYYEKLHVVLVVISTYEKISVLVNCL